MYLGFVNTGQKLPLDASFEMVKLFCNTYKEKF